MLGLGNSLLAPNIRYELTNSYTSDFTSDIDGFAPFSIQNSSTDLTLTANNNPYDDLGGSAPNSDGWLKGVYGVTQTNSSGIRRITSDYQTAPGDFSNVSYKMYIFDDSNNYWENYFGGVLVSTFFASGTNPGSRGIDVSKNTESQIEWKIFNNPILSSFQLTLTFSYPLSHPQAGAVFYIKDVLTKTYRLLG